ncbi:hypothetical protein MoryE10_07150 [Methylogaea oryzae]|uniref:Porin n=1 Tax=Methylogaea oryzae TaxID=1295382 RepID=A0A8D5AIU5_9GAMM|nr:hypothetical protein MoryE10_07150 [Methylogaea oryzae]
MTASAADVPEFGGYRLGRGYRIADTDLTLGGYANLDVMAPHSGGSHAELSDLSLFITWQASEHWRLFSEVEVEDGLTIREGHGVDAGPAAIRLERLYSDFSFNESANVRVGKFLTPIGRWNLIHADPLVWTTSRPVVTQVPFSQRSAGAMVFGDIPLLGRNLEYQAYASVLPDPARHPDDGEFGNAYGMHTTYGEPGRAQIGFSYASFRSSPASSAAQNLFGVDGFWTHGRYELSGEFVYRRSSGVVQQDAWGLYAQGVAPLSERLYAVGRYEVYKGVNASLPAQLWIGGLAYKPVTPLVFKLEYGAGTHTTAETPVGLAASVSVLF